MHSTHSPLRLIGSSPIDCNFLPFQLLLDKNPKSTKLIKDLRLEGTISNLCLLFEPLTSMSRILHGEFKERKKMELRFSLNLVFGFYLFLVCTLLLLPSHWQACKEWLHMSVPLFHQVKIWTGFLFLFFSIANDLTPFNTDFKKKLYMAKCTRGQCNTLCEGECPTSPLWIGIVHMVFCSYIYISFLNPVHFSPQWSHWQVITSSKQQSLTLKGQYARYGLKMLYIVV